MAQNIFETLLELIFFFFCPILGISLNVAQEATVRAGEHRSEDEGHRRSVAIKAALPSPLWLCSTARLGSCWLEWLGVSAPGGTSLPSPAPRVGRKGGQLGSHLLCQPQQPDHPVAPTQPNVSTVDGQERVPTLCSQVHTWQRFGRRLGSTSCTGERTWLCNNRIPLRGVTERGSLSL